MGFKFSYICDLLSSLDENRRLKRTTAAGKDIDRTTVANWFRLHGKRIHDGNTDYLALLSCLFPELRPDRVYGFREPSLVKIIGRCLLLGTSRQRELELWKSKGAGDLAQCVEYVMRAAENQLDVSSSVTVEELETALNKIAARSRFSAPDLRRQRSAVQVDEALGRIFRRLTSRDAKWLTRLLLKEYTPVEIPQRWTLRKFHFLLPALLSVRSSLKAALEAMDRGPMKQFPPCPDPEYGRALMELSMPHLAPQVGIKVGRPEYYKGRSLKHCCRMAGNRLMSVERKYDGEYCQVHIDLERRWDCIRIFSKSGKESTVDRKGMHGAIRDSLKIRKPGCRFSKRCILEGELLVWSDIKHEILPFYHLRKHVMRAGTFIGTESDSPCVYILLYYYFDLLISFRPDPQEHLFVVFFDLLLLDDNVALAKPYRERRALLTEVVNPIEGLTDITPQFNIDFSRPSAYERLKDEFSLVSAQKWEGLVLKGADEPYFRTFSQDTSEFSCCWVKFKKESIPGLGDTADFVLIGGRYDSRDAVSLDSIKPLSWTSFFIGCLDDDSGCKPTFRIIDILNKQNINTQLLQTLNQLGQFQACDVDSDDAPFSLRVDQVRLPKIQVMFRTPFIVEMTGFGFDKPQGARYYSLRFPRVVKIHSDREYDAATSFKELQELARVANSVPVEELSQEAAELAEKMDPTNKKPQYIVDHSENSATTMTISSVATSSQPLIACSDRSRDCEPSQGAEIQLIPPISGQKRKLEVRDGFPSMSQNAIKVTPTPVSILPDATQTLSSSSSDEQQPPYRHLSNITNLAEVKCSPPSTNEPCHGEMGLITETSAQKGESTASSLSDSLPLNPGFLRSHSFQSYHSHNSNEKPSQELSLTRSSSNLSERSRRPNPMEDSPFTKLPVFLSSTLSDATTSLLRRYIPSCRSSIAPSSVSRWLTSLAALQDTPQAPPMYSIVLVDSNRRNLVVSDMTQVGETLVSLRRRGKIPGIGKVMFMHWKVVGLEFNASKAGDELVDRWKRFGKGNIVGCLKWGYGEVPECGSRNQNESVDSSGVQKERSNDVCYRGDWTEVLSLLQRRHITSSAS
ncbi:hypothetical protein FQN49_004751 [Arthroderma sp. PD_2]|nr:hypothetical protein FQN49_004751 [Arthroderma sp. PD_2]